MAVGGRSRVQRQQRGPVTAILRTERLRSQRRLLRLLPRDERIAAFAVLSSVLWRCLNRDVPELGPLVNLAVQLGIISHRSLCRWTIPRGNRAPVVRAQSERQNLRMGPNVIRRLLCSPPLK
jgi:hypothetical protein